VYGNVVDLDLLTEIERLQICTTIQDFIKACLINLMILLSIDDDIISKISALDPYCGTHQKDLSELAKRFDNIILPKEYHLFVKETKSWAFDTKLKDMRKDHTTEFKDFDAITFYKEKWMNEKYSLITRLARALLSLPHSSASIERAFSQMKLIKNERRTKLSNECLESLLIGKINGIELTEPNTLDLLYDFNDKDDKKKKRTHSEMSQSQTTQKDSSQIIPSQDSQKDSTDQKKKKRWL